MEAHAPPSLIMPLARSRSGSVPEISVFSSMSTSNYCIACPSTFERGLVATLEAEVSQGRLQCWQGIEQPLHEQAPSGLAANFTLHIMGTFCTSYQVKWLADTVCS